MCLGSRGCWRCNLTGVLGRRQSNFHPRPPRPPRAIIHHQAPSSKSRIKASCVDFWTCHYCRNATDAVDSTAESCPARGLLLIAPAAMAPQPSTLPKPGARPSRPSLGQILALPPQWLGMYEEFITKNAGQVSQIESALRSLTYIIPGTLFAAASHKF